MTKQERFGILMLLVIIVFTVIPMLYIRLSARCSNDSHKEERITIIAKGGDIVRVFIEVYGDKAFIIIFAIVSVVLLVYSIEKIYPIIFNRRSS